MIEGYERVKGTARRYRNKETGKEISRWDYDKLRKGGLDARAIAKIRKTLGIRTKNTAAQHRLNGFIQAYKNKRARQLGKKPKDIKVRGQSDEAIYFRSLHNKLKKINKGKNVDKSPNGALAKILTELGLRDPEWEYPVGHSPT